MRHGSTEIWTRYGGGRYPVARDVGFVTIITLFSFLARSPRGILEFFDERFSVCTLLSIRRNVA